MYVARGRAGRVPARPQLGCRMPRPATTGTHYFEVIRSILPALADARLAIIPVGLVRGAGGLGASRSAPLCHGAPAGRPAPDPTRRRRLAGSDIARGHVAGLCRDPREHRRPCARRYGVAREPIPGACRSLGSGLVSAGFGNFASCRDGADVWNAIARGEGVTTHTLPRLAPLPRSRILGELCALATNQRAERHHAEAEQTERARHRDIRFGFLDAANPHGIDVEAVIAAAVGIGLVHQREVLKRTAEGQHRTALRLGVAHKALRSSSSKFGFRRELVGSLHFFGQGG